MTRRTSVRSRTVLAAVVLTALMAGLQGVAMAALPAPNWLPGQPILAGSQMIAMWLPVPGAAKYIIYIDGKKLTESPANQYLGPAPEAAGRHSVTVSAVDASGAESPQSQPGYISIVKIEAPGRPALRTDPEAQEVLLRWGAVQGAMIYNVYKGDSQNGPFNLLSSTQEQTFTDKGLEYGKQYFYSVSAKDAGGKESDRGPVVDVKIEKPKAVAQADIFDLKIVPTTEVDRVTFFGDVPIGTISRFKPGPDGNNYVVYRSDLIRVVDEDMQRIRDIRVPLPAGLNKLQLWNLSFIDEDTALVCDLNNFAVHLVDLGKGVIVETYRSSKPTEDQDKKVYDALSARFKVSRLQPLSAVSLADGTIWVADGNGGIIHHLDEDGNTLDWLAFFISGEGADAVEKRLSGIPDMLALDGGDILVFSDRFAIRLDPASARARWLAGEAGTMVGNFIGFGGMSLLDNDQEVVIADPTMHTVQVFDIDSGKYLFSLGGPTPDADPQQNTRAKLDYIAPFYPFINGKGQLAVFLGFDKNFLLRSIDGEMPHSAAAKPGS